MNDSVKTEDTKEYVGGPTPAKLREGNPRIFRLVMLSIATVGIFLIIYGLNSGIGSLRSPGSGMLILLMGAAIVISVPFAWATKETFEIFDFNRVGNVLAMIVGLFSFVAFYWLLGFFAAGVLTMVIITRWSARESWRNTFLIALITPAAAYLIFSTAFNVPLSLLPGWV